MARHFIHLAAVLLVIVAASSVTSSIPNAASKTVGKLKPIDDLWIDDEGDDDDIQLNDEASGSGPLMPGKSLEIAEEDEDGDEYDEEDVEEDDKDEVAVGAPVAVETPKLVVEKRVEEVVKEEVAAVPPPKVSPVSGRISSTSAINEDDEDDDDIQGSGNGGAGGSGDGSDDDVEEDDYVDPDIDNEDIDLTSIVGETEVTPHVDIMKPEVKPEIFQTPPPPPSQPSTPRPSKELPPPPPSPAPVPAVPTQQPVPAQGEENELAPQPTLTPSGVPVNGQGSNKYGNDVQVQDPKPDDRPTSFFAQPGILAAVIGGAVVGLLCAILLVMFIVYRMRKKDEGSYVLDEPKRNSPNSHPYHKNSREFYA